MLIDCWRVNTSTRTKNRKVTKPQERLVTTVISKYKWVNDMSAMTDFNNLTEVASDFRRDLTGDNRKEKDLILFFAHNGTGKTRLSMEFKEIGKTGGNRDSETNDGAGQS